MEDCCNVSLNTLMDENKDLRYEIEQQLSIIESQKQEIHTSHRKLDCLNTMKMEMEIEIEALHGLHQINGNLESQIKVLESDLSNSKVKCTTMETELQSEKSKHETIVAELQTEISNLKQESQMAQPNDEEKSVLLSQINVLQETNLMLTDSSVQLQEQNRLLSEKTFVLELSLNEKNQELQEMKDMLEAKSNDLHSALKLIEELQEEKATLNSELNSLKCHPANVNKRGNSLFAEVDDKRISVSNKLEIMSNKYKELKKSFMKKNAELRAVEAENIELRKQWKEDENDPYKNMASLVGGYKLRIQELCQTISTLEKRPESPQIISISDVTDAHVNCIKTLVDNERKINQQLRHEMEQRSIRELSQNEQLFELRQMLKTLKTQGMKDSASISELKLKLEKAKVKEKEPLKVQN